MNRGGSVMVCLPWTGKGERATARDEDPLPRAVLSPSWEVTDLKLEKQKGHLDVLHISMSSFSFSLTK